MKQIRINTGHMEEIIHQADEGHPDEVCGILAGRGNIVEEVFQVHNTDHSPVSYFMDTREQFRVMKDIRQKGLEMLGIYHSHPDADAYPSIRDTRLAFYDDVAYIIISLLHEHPVVRAFSIINGEVDEIEIVEV
jgi:proteasome lid subunit RPN8/RPN11